MQAGLGYGHTYQMANYVNKRERWKSRAGDKSESALWEMRGLVLKKSLHQKLAASRLLSKKWLKSTEQSLGSGGEDSEGPKGILRCELEPHTPHSSYK